MISALTRLLTIDAFHIGWFIICSFLIGMLYTKFIFLVYPFKKLFSLIFPRKTDCDQDNFPSGMVIIPSLLRDEFDFKEIQAAVDSAAFNNYPGQLYIITSVDGKSENISIYNQLVDWMKSKECAPNVHLYVSHNEVRRGKLMAVHAGIEYMQALVSNGTLAALPKIYFSMDADESLVDGSLQKLVEKLMTRHWITGNYRRMVQAHVITSKGDMWKGWKSFFTVAGQNYLWVARGFLYFTSMEENINILPIPILLGQLHCTWSEVMVEAPRFMGWLQTVKLSQWVGWWFGKGAPKFSEYTGKSLPEGLCGNTDDSSIAMFIGMSHWEKGKLSWDAPSTPLHAFGRLLIDTFIDRVQSFEQAAKVYSFTPPKLKGLWNQRKRWMACRVEVNGRFFRGFLFHWGIAFAFYANYLQAVYGSAQNLIYYGILPYMMWENTSLLNGIIFVYAISFVIQSIYIGMIWLFEPKRREFTELFIASMLSPFMQLFALMFYSAPMIVGAFEDIFLFGCNVKFYPTRTLIASKAQRIALAYRARRFLSLCWRSIQHGDVPLSWKWISWYEWPEFGLTNGFTGWTKDNKSDYILR